MDKTELIEEFKLAEDWRYDPWGSAMGVLFDLAEYLYVRDMVPEAWEFRPGAGKIVPEVESYWYPLFSASDPATLIEFGNILNRYTAKLRSAGQDY